MFWTCHSESCLYSDTMKWPLSLKDQTIWTFSMPFSAVSLVNSYWWEKGVKGESNNFVNILKVYWFSLWHDVQQWLPVLASSRTQSFMTWTKTNCKKQSRYTWYVWTTDTSSWVNGVGKVARSWPDHCYSPKMLLCALSLGVCLRTRPYLTSN